MKTKIIYLSILILLCNSCAYYSFKGSLPVHIKNICIIPVINESNEFSAAELLNDELNTYMLSENILDIVSPDNADSQLEIIIKDMVN